jgi:hypothetical protein
MAETKKGAKYNNIASYIRTSPQRKDGSGRFEVEVKAHRRSNPRTSTGKAKQ